ncbi:hypothetical protein LX87_04664 [Larkinella arboricola]|uniref:Alpha-L-rhamnosidase six-hairpin glycosidase domain-containing protein n=1 Tax=Larkinella arboricola TaxID=643671 RepID=A0A327WQN1_LARAB|nr:hypothetical protein [Larkinella arboricola]RAJ93152.1 hypothetical protein LX87_04664 [Larkinella arboricola]
MDYKWISNAFVVLLVVLESKAFAQQAIQVRVEWKDGTSPSGTVQVQHGVLRKIERVAGKGKIKANGFQVGASSRPGILIAIDSAQTGYGSGSTVVSIKTTKNPFSFFLRDVTANSPIYMPDYGVVVLNAADRRSYQEVETAVRSRNTMTKLQRIETEGEVSFASVEKKVRNMTVPTWLGTSRDFRLFQITENLSDASQGEASIISPKWSSTALRLAETKNEPVNYLYTYGRGVGVKENVTRQLEQGTLPILHSTLTDDDVVYKSTTFVALEKSPLTQLKGTDFWVADSYSGGHMFTKEQQEQVNTRTGKALNPDEETVLFFRSEVVNTGSVPRYAWFKTPRPGTAWWQKFPYRFDAKTGFSAYSEEKVFCISKLNGKPLPSEEMAILLQPGEKARFDFFIPHSPVSNERAAQLAMQTFEQRYAESRDFWLAKLEKAAQIHVPEKRIDEMIQAGLLHLDLITYGNEPDATLAPNIGVYSPIGTESAPIIQFYNSMGWNDVARRSLNYFLDKQHEDGFIQNFNGYMVETGAALWSMGEYFRYTNDREWVEKIKAKLLKSCDYLIAWRNRNKKEELRGRGYGMIEGKVADPEDHFHQFMLNGYAYLGMSRSAEMLASVDPAQSERIRKEADAWKEDIRQSFFTSMALSPVVPLGDGTWCPTAPPWTEGAGLRNMYQKRETFWSHGTFTAPDAMLGPMYLVFCEVLDPREPAAKNLLNYHSELFYQENSAFSQPYYSRHNWMQAKLSMTKPFLSTYYHTFAAHADRETYTFWEHLFKVSPHKTHEEAWFLMETRWMLYLEDGPNLKLFNTVPRQWLEQGKKITLSNVRSYFGPVSATVVSEVDKGYITATVNCPDARKPNEVLIRVPHPAGKKPVNVTGGIYNKQTETVSIKPFSGQAEIRLEY